MPGSGQALNGRGTFARWLALPFLVIVALAGLVGLTQPPARLFATIIAPQVLGGLLLLNAILLVWRLFAVGHAFFDRRYPGRSGRAGALGLTVALAFVVVPHAYANAWGEAARSTFEVIFSGDPAFGEGSGELAAGTREPAAGERVNVLVVGVDSTPGRTTDLTDTMMVVSFDPVGASASIVSFPRDIVGAPLGDGGTFDAKLNALMSYANRHPERFPEGGLRALEDALGAMLGVTVHYYVRMDFAGFVGMVDAVDGIDVEVEHGFYDPDYDGIGLDGRGWGVEAGLNHFDGAEALAYARVRKAPGESDFTRAARQQEILLALRERALEGGSILFHLPDLLSAVGRFVRTDVPIDRLPALAAAADEMTSGSISRTVIARPLVTPENHAELGSIQRPDLALIREMAAALLTPPGTPPATWSPVTP